MRLTERNENSLFKAIYTSYKHVQKRNFVEDSQDFLQEGKIEYLSDCSLKSLALTPTIIASNHYTKPLFKRKSIFTTLDSITTSAIIGVEIAKLSKRKITWVVKNDLKTNIVFLDIKTRKIQHASIYCYDFIGVGKNYPCGNPKKWQRALEAGFNIGFYPEGKTSTSLNEAKKGFKNTYEFLKKEKVIFQILPVAIFEKNGKHVIKFATPIKNSIDIENEVMLAIAKLLPKNLRGYYKNKI